MGRSELNIRKGLIIWSEHDWVSSHDFVVHYHQRNDTHFCYRSLREQGTAQKLDLKIAVLKSLVRLGRPSTLCALCGSLQHGCGY
jgi:hypothetical protein